MVAFPRIFSRSRCEEHKLLLEELLLPWKVETEQGKKRQMIRIQRSAANMGITSM